ncbi:23S rRNA (uridine(2479)-2'-O)-methyltransferase [Caprobacter fermentans]|uniref:23S rRNA (Uridine(2479)-2'-O)-methyltransferase n=1 Tax=Caproicibacter fermentans TaxID=2576756 RepID=A0A6N8I199_9FIRM|nr:RNA methyltransferase [Caproicibacter fermentans]MVB11886.1 23S rRNA (uridine(2479)-2'-O)-methyltransferase [Caproicibacter fermentans]QNK41122.1 RNA methyltransferase [Caproicibacter fermentans]
MPEIILSRRNEIIQSAIRLSGSADYRRERGLYFLEGARLCSDAACSGVAVQKLLYTERAGEKYAKYLSSVLKTAREVYLVGPQAAQALSCTKSPQGIFCVCEMPRKIQHIADLNRSGPYLALENLQDPANMGTILRTAEALGVYGVILGGSCCDIYSPKVLRASMGAVFRMPVFVEENLPSAFLGLNRRGFLTAAAVPDSDALPVTKMNFSVPCVLTVGNEGNGLTEETRKACSVQVTIPMLGRAESLNASAAAAVLIWEMMRNRAGGAGL